MHQVNSGIRVSRMPGARMLWIVQMKLIAPRIEDSDRMCRPTIQKSMPWPGEITDSGGEPGQPASRAPPHAKLEDNVMPPNSSSQKQGGLNLGEGRGRGPAWGGAP